MHGVERELHAVENSRHRVENNRTDAAHHRILEGKLWIAMELNRNAMSMSVQGSFISMQSTFSLLHCMFGSRKCADMSDN